MFKVLRPEHAGCVQGPMRGPRGWNGWKQKRVVKGVVREVAGQAGPLR